MLYGEDLLGRRENFVWSKRVVSAMQDGSVSFLIQNGSKVSITQIFDCFLDNIGSWLVNADIRCTYH